MKIIKDVKSVFIGIVIGLLLAIPVISFASVGEKVTAVFSTFKFVVNGEQKTLDSDPLVYQGSTYLPVKVVSTMLGYDVTYKADERTIQLNNPVVPSNENNSNIEKAPEASPLSSVTPNINQTYYTTKDLSRAFLSYYFESDIYLEYSFITKGQDYKYAIIIDGKEIKLSSSDKFYDGYNDLSFIASHYIDENVPNAVIEKLTKYEFDRSMGKMKKIN